MPAPRSIFLNPTDDEVRYFQAIDDVFRGESKQVISNSKPGHAVYLIYKFLESAERSLKICTGCLAQEVRGVWAYGDPMLAESAARFLQKPNAELSIVLLDDKGPELKEGESLADHPFLAKIKQASHTLKGTLKVFQVSSKWYRDFSFRHHFLVMDNHALRVETHDGEAETPETRAIATLHNEEFAESVADVFGWIRKESELLLTLPART